MVDVLENGVFVVSGRRCVHCSCDLCIFCRRLRGKSCMPCWMCWVMSIVMCWLVVLDCGRFVITFFEGGCGGLWGVVYWMRCVCFGGMSVVMLSWWIGVCGMKCYCGLYGVMFISGWVWWCCGRRKVGSFFPHLYGPYIDSYIFYQFTWHTLMCSHPMHVITRGCGCIITMLTLAH